MKFSHKDVIAQLSFFLLSFLLLFSFGGLASAAEKHNSSSKKSGIFEAEISGAYSGKVSGNGILKYIPTCGFEKKGCFFLADGRGIRPHGVTFILPKGLTTGKHKLHNPSPLENGTVPSVRVDRDMGNATVSFQKNTIGFLELIKFPVEKEKINSSQASGKFQFSTEDTNGKKITVEGNFSFTAK